MNVDSEQENAEAWTAYGTHHLQRGTLVPDPGRLDFGFWGTGPGLEVLGDIASLRVLDLGCGTGKFAALVARERAALIDAVDCSPTQHQRAVTRYGGRRGLRFVLADAVTHLRSTAEPYDLIYSVHGLGYINPHRLLPALMQALKPGGRLVFSVLHTNSAGAPPFNTVTPRPEILRWPAVAG
ncbi:class I SAM-dependent methyltransferase [Streptomyces maoxianensis]|uniref:Class I SAM-dependent methyltransferase n=1 Tax=Streptomyces maoxianensis TaxID=1459942 RepID=A0ABV9G7P2_9ACTN